MQGKPSEKGAVVGHVPVWDMVSQGGTEVVASCICLGFAQRGRLCSQACGAHHEQSETAQAPGWAAMTGEPSHDGKGSTLARAVP